jgi:hypothetical protein
VSGRRAEAARALCAFVAVGLAVALAGCRHDGARHLDREAEAYVRLVLALGERDADSLDFYAGPPEWMAEARAKQTPLSEIKRSASVLLDELTRERVQAPGGEPRRPFLIGQLRAVAARVDLLSGQRLTFDEESRLLFGIEPGETDQRAFADADAELERMLPGHGALGHRYAAYERRFVIPSDRLPAVITRAIDGCRRATLGHLSLPAGEQVTVEYVRGTPWSAFTRYEGRGRSRMQINTDFDLTVDRALQLACHEAYPGHHAINSLIDARLVDAQHWIEYAVQPMFSPQSLRTEGAATFAAELAFEGESRLAFERDVLFPLAGLTPLDADKYLRISRLVDGLRGRQLDIARRYLDGNLEFARAAQELEERALMPSADATLKFFNEFRTYALAYTVGRDAAARSIAAADDRWQAYERWLTEMK